MKQFTCLFFSVIIFFSCRNEESEQERILRQFDSVNKGLKETPETGYKGVGGFKSIGETFMPRQSAYDSIIKKLGDGKRSEIVMQMEYEVGAFYQNMNGLQAKFYIACGDNTGTYLPEHSEDKISVTNEFFNAAPATYLLSWLLAAKKSLAENAPTDSIRQLIRSIGKLDEYKSSYTAEYWRNKYFKDVPPVAAITILNNFEQQVMNIEQSILQDYLKK
jgi:hypothetical protein